MCNRKKDQPHYHDYIQLWYVFNGTLRHTVRDREYIQTSGSCVIVLPFTEHAIDTLDSDDTPVTLSLSFTDEFFALRGIDVFSYIKEHAHFDGYSIPEYSLLDGKDKEKADALARDMLSIFAPNKDPDFDAVTKPFNEFMHLFCREPSRKEDISLIIERAKAIRRAVSYIADHSGEKIMRDELCSITAMSRTVFSNAFKEITGTTTKEFLLSLRLRKAQFLLQYTDKTLNEIASEVGLYDKSRLTHIFCEHLGMPPIQFRHKTRPDAIASDKQTRRRMKFYPKLLDDDNKRRA